jgi:hypothetical protein
MSAFDKKAEKVRVETCACRFDLRKAELGSSSLERQVATAIQS